MKNLEIKKWFYDQWLNRKLALLGLILCLLFLGAVYYKRQGTRNFIIRHRLLPLYKAKENTLAHQLLKVLRGIEIGTSAHNPFGLNTLNVDYTDDYTTVYKKEEISLCGN